MMTIVFTIVFQLVAPSSIAYFPLFIMIGWLAWTFTLSALTDSVNTIVTNSSLVKKVWFPRIVLPASTVLSSAVNFLLAIPLILGLMFYFQIPLDLQLLVYFPVIFASQIALIMGLSFILAGANVFYRDTKVIVGVLMTAWFFLTPVFYAPSDVPNTRLFYYINPMASIIEGYRSIFYGSTNGAPPGPPDIAFLLRTLGTSLVILILGYIYFYKVSPKFGEEL
jgi:ABC-type polysaccharide/polyol phosphate export permease